MTNAKFSQVIAAINARAALSEGAAKDLARLTGNKAKYAVTEVTVNYAESVGVDCLEIVNLPQKQVFRAFQFLNACAIGTPGYFDRTHARIIAALSCADGNPLAYDALISLAAGVIAPTANTRGITRSQIEALFKLGQHSIGTVPTKVSNSVGARGFMQAFNLTASEGTSQNRPVYLNTDHPMVQRAIAVMTGATVGQLAAIAEGKDD